MSRKSIRIDTGKEQRCPLDDPEARLSYKNTEGYADPTCFFALCNVMRQEKKQHRDVYKRQGLPCMFYIHIIDFSFTGCSEGDIEWDFSIFSRRSR